MSKRLQVLFDTKEYKELALAAKKSKMSIGEWVRQMVRASLKVQAVRPAEEKLKAIRSLSSHSYSVGSIDNILEEIEKGRFDKE